MRRDVVRLVTPGTITEERLLEPGRANYLLAIARRRVSDTQFCYGLAAVDISTGHFALSETDGTGLAAEIARFEPREILVPDVIHDDPDLRSFWQETRASITPLPREGLDPASAERRLKGYFGVATLDAFGAFSPAEITAAGSALFYIEKTQIDSRPTLNPPSRDTSGAALAIDAATRANLELTRTLSGRAGRQPARHHRLHGDAGRRAAPRRAARRPPHRIRTASATGRIPSRRSSRTTTCATGCGASSSARPIWHAPSPASASDAAARGISPACATACSPRASSGSNSPSPPICRESCARPRNACRDCARMSPTGSRAALADELPLLKRDGGFMRAGFDPSLDELRELQQDSRRFIAALQSRYATETGCRTLRVKHNHMIGYFVEVPQNVGEDLLKEPWKDTFVHRQTMAGAMRFSTMELGELESKIASAADRALKIELALFDEMVQALLDLAADVAAAAEAIAVIDVSASLADLAMRLDWTRPVVDTGLAFTVKGGRHPVVEAALKREGVPFIANDSDLSGKDAGHILLITGPNMGGKSTYLRQNALIVVLAQMGSYVPAKEAHLGIVDRLFSRVGAADDLARGRSTFMVEMVETAAILNQATARSLVILDEIGRGTATFDGLSIAWAAIEHLHEANRCRALFATHFHELTALAERMARISNATLKVTEWNGEVVFLHEVVPGAADRSYGLQVARLAGLPVPVVERAKTILSELEKSDREAPKRALVDDLPLFSVSMRQEPAPASKPDVLREALDALDPDQMTPREALDALYRLKAQR